MTMLESAWSLSSFSHLSTFSNVTAAQKNVQTQNVILFQLVGRCINSPDSVDWSKNPYFRRKQKALDEHKQLA